MRVSDSDPEARPPVLGFTGAKILQLPFEIRLLILSHVRQQDVVRVARVCWSWLPVARYLIYRNIHLEADNPHLSLTLSALENKDVSSRVRTLRLTSSKVQRAETTRYDHWLGQGLSTTWIPYDLLSSMPRLEELTLVGCPFATSFEQHAFVSTIRRCCPVLGRFTYQPLKTTFPESSSPFDIGNLHTIIWHTPYASGLKSQALSLVSASLTTLTDLRVLKHREILPCTSIDISQWHTLLSLQFPALTSLTFGHLDTQHHYPALRTEDLTKFLVAHPLLTYLSLGADLAKGHYMKIAEFEDADNTNLITKSFLPALRSLSTHQSNLSLLAQRRVRSLHRLTDLAVLYTSYGRPPRSAVAEYHSFDVAGGFPAVTTLRIELETDSYSLTKTAQVMNERLARVCPEIRKWEGNLQMVLDKDELATFFSSYPNIEIISAPGRMLLPSSLSSSDLADHLGPLTLKCPNLKGIHVPPNSAMYSGDREGVMCIITHRYGSGVELGFGEGPGIGVVMYEEKDIDDKIFPFI